MESLKWPEVWQAAYSILEQSILSSQLRSWVQPLELTDIKKTEKGLCVQFTAPNDFSADWIKNHYLEAMESSLAQVTGIPCEIVFIIDPSATPTEETPAAFELPVLPVTQEERPIHLEANPSRLSSVQTPSPVHSNSFSGRRSEVSKQYPSSSSEISLEPRYTFDSFVVGASNQFAYASAVAVAEQPARQYNPLFIYSSPGLGKTHLLHAIANHFLSKNPSSRIAYLSAERFVNELVEALQYNRMPDFRNKYRDSYDMILIDDIQFIAGKAKSEEEFFHTFNALHGTKRQIIVTSDRPPKDIEGLEERIRTRFEWGLLVDIHLPEIETRIAILKAKAERDDLYLPDDVATFLGSHVKSNVRELEGILIRLQAQASLTGAEISLEMAKQELKNLLPEESSHLTIDSIQGAVAKHFQLKLQDLRSTTRARPVARPRQIAMFLIRKYTSLGYKEIGQYFGGKDHTTILHACHKIEEEMERDSEIRDAVESIQNQL